MLEDISKERPGSTWLDRHLVIKLLIKRVVSGCIGDAYAGKRMKAHYISRFLKDAHSEGVKRVLDIGCGDGLYTVLAAKVFTSAEVIGLDYDIDHIKACQRVSQLLGPRRVKFIAASAEQPVNFTGADIVFCFDVLEHIEDDLAALRAMGGTLSANGQLLIHVPSRHYLGLDGAFKTVEDCDAHLVNPGHVRQGYTKEELHALVEKAGFVVKYMEFWHGPLTELSYTLQNYFQNHLFHRFFQLLSLPLIDIIVSVDMTIRKQHGNTLWCVVELR